MTNRKLLLSDCRAFPVSYLVCRNEVDENSIQQFLSNSISLRDDGTHQIHHVHLNLLVMAVTEETEKPLISKKPKNKEKGSCGDAVFKIRPNAAVKSKREDKSGLKATYLITENRVLKSWMKISLQSSSSKHML